MKETKELTVLVVDDDDDDRLASLVSEYLGKEGFLVTTEGHGDRAMERILSEKPDVVILDVMLPGMDGFEICRKVRDRFSGLIIMLTARGEEIEEVLGLELGADDYLAKPLRPRVLLTRIKALLRRVQSAPAGSDVLPVGDLKIDPASRSVRLGEKEIETTTSEFDLLCYLARRAGEVVSRDDLYQELRGMEYDGLDRSIDLAVARLRKKLGDDARHPRRIKSVRGLGYLLAPES